MLADRKVLAWLEEQESLLAHQSQRRRGARAPALAHAAHPPSSSQPALHAPLDLGPQNNPPPVFPPVAGPAAPLAAPTASAVASTHGDAAAQIARDERSDAADADVVTSGDAYNSPYLQDSPAGSAGSAGVSGSTQPALAPTNSAPQHAFGGRVIELNMEDLAVRVLRQQQELLAALAPSDGEGHVAAASGSGEARRCAAAGSR